MKIAFYCPNKPLSSPNPSGDLIIAGSIQRALNELGHRCEEVVSFRSRWFWESPRRVTAAFFALSSALHHAVTFRPDIWLTYHTYYKSPDIIGPIISRFIRIPYVLFQPMYSTKRRKERRARIGFALNRFALRAADYSVSNNVNDLEALGRILHPDRFSYLPPGIFTEDFQQDATAGNLIRRKIGIAEDVPLLFTAARFRRDVKFESLSYLLESLSLLRKIRPNFALLVAGDGPMESELRKMAHEVVPGLVTFAGRVRRQEMSHYYSAADLFVFPGIGESLGMVYLEAQCCGLPVVALATAGVPQVVRHGETGLLVPRDDGHSMAHAIDRLLENENLRRDFGANASRFVRTERNLRVHYRQLSMTLEKIGNANGGKSSFLD